MYIPHKDRQSSPLCVYNMYIYWVDALHILYTTRILCRITKPLQKLSKMFNNFIHSPFYFQRISFRLYHYHRYTINRLIRFKTFIHISYSIYMFILKL
jgi:hypothetical protein